MKFPAASSWLSLAVVFSVPALASAQETPTATSAGADAPSGAAPGDAAAQPLPSETAPADAIATTSTSAEEDEPKMDLSVAPPPPALQRTAFVHEGFYLRVAVGPGILWSNVNDTSAANADASGVGFALGGDVMVGGSPSPGIALGVGALTNIGLGLNQNDSSGNSLGSTTQFQYLVGPFFDAFPNDKRGFHLGAEVGFAGTTLDRTNVSSAFGGGAAAWLGYDMWVAPEWSAGFEFRGGGAYMGAADLQAAAFNMAFLITVLNH